MHANLEKLKTRVLGKTNKSSSLAINLQTDSFMDDHFASQILFPFSRNIPRALFDFLSLLLGAISRFTRSRVSPRFILHCSQKRKDLCIEKISLRACERDYELTPRGDRGESVVGEGNKGV